MKRYNVHNNCHIPHPGEAFLLDWRAVISFARHAQDKLFLITDKPVSLVADLSNGD